MARKLASKRRAASWLWRAGACTALLLVVGCGTTASTTRPTLATGAAASDTAATGAGTAPPGAHPAATTATSATSATRSSSGGASAPTGPAAPPAPPAAAPHTAVPRPHVVWDPIPFSARRKAEMVAYARRHYASFMAPTYRLLHPHVIVIHYTETPTFSSTFNTFAPDTPDPELHELPNTCAHFVIDSAGTIHQLVPLGIMCRHTVGLNWTAIGIEHVGFSDRQVLGDRAQMSASLRLVRWLRCRYGISIRNVIGHNESLSSPFHREDVPSLRTQTHSDFNRADMRVYRRRLAAAGGCG